MTFRVASSNLSNVIDYTHEIIDAISDTIEIPVDTSSNKAINDKLSGNLFREHVIAVFNIIL